MEKDSNSKSYREKYSIRRGNITLYRRTAQGTKYQSDSWYAAFKIPNQKLLRKSLKTTDRSEAELLAENLYYDLLEKSKRGLSIKSKKFKLASKSYITSLVENVDRERNISLKDRRYKPNLVKSKNLIIEKYLIPYFKDKTLQNITDFDIESYKDWRNTYWISGEGSQQDKISYLRDGVKIERPKNKSEKREPSYSTINKELTVIREVFEYARLNRIIEGREIPVIKNLRKPKNLKTRKPGLTEDEVKHLLKTTASRYYEQTNPKHKRHLKLLLHYMAWMCLTGLRVAEAKNLHINDCEQYKKNGKNYLKIFVHGKGKSRELIGLEESTTLLQKFVDMHTENSKIHGWKFTKEMPLFLDQYGNSVNSFGKGLDRALEDAGLLYDKHGLKRTAGAFRKYYITQALLVGDVNYFQLAKQCGTSVSVIEQYYSEIETFHTPEQFIFENALSGVYDN